MTAEPETDGDESDDPDPPVGGAWSWRRAGGFALALAAVFLLLPWTSPSPSVSDELTAQFAARSHADDVAASLEEVADASSENPLSARYRGSGPAEATDSVRSELEKIDALALDQEADHEVHASVRRSDDGERILLEVTLLTPRGQTAELWSGDRRIGDWTSVLPPLIAVLVALFFRRLVAALLAAVWLGAALDVGFGPIAATRSMVQDYLWASIADSFSLYIIGFTFCLVGMVHVIIRMGGVAGLLQSFAWLAKSARSTRIATALMGLALFFDDYANTVVVGTTMRPMTDRNKISREKLAYLVDSTSAPIAGLAVVSTWIGYEVGLFEELAAQIQLEMSGYGVFFHILPLRFYCILTLVFVAAVAVSGLDFGSMLRAERRAHHRGEVLRPGSTPLTGGSEETVPREEIPHRWYNAVIPVAVVVCGTLIGMYWSGWRGPDGAGIPGLGAVLTGSASPASFFAAWDEAIGGIGSWRVWREALSQAANAKVLFEASIVGSLVAVALAVGQRLLTLRDAVRSWLKAIPMMGLAVAILVLAWSIQGVCEEIGTSIYLVATVRDLLIPAALPALTFGLAALVAFSTGTSWGTMGILLPAMIPLAAHMTASSPDNLLLMMCFGAVLDGAIFGDHCSPISDTTVMSSIASSVDHVDHVQTQLPYAMTSMLASVAFGYVGVAAGLPLWAAYPLAAAALVAVLFVAGRDPTEAPPE